MTRRGYRFWPKRPNPRLFQIWLPRRTQKPIRQPTRPRHAPLAAVWPRFQNLQTPVSLGRRSANRTDGRGAVKIHRFARANFISGFASSWLKTREYGIGSVGFNDPKTGMPALDANGGQLSIRSAVETHNQPP